MSIHVEKLIHVFERPNITTLTSERRVTALAGLSFSVSEGEFVVFVGPSGSGKTTLLGILSTQLAPTAGVVTIDNTEPFSMDIQEIESVRRSSVGYLQQILSNNVLLDLTLWENVEYLHMFLDSFNPSKDEVSTLLNDLGLDRRLLNIKLRLLSGGELQRISLVLLTLRDPKIMLLDEPTSFLDEKSKKLVLTHLKKLHRSGKTIMVSTHDHELVPLAEAIYTLDDGKLRTQDNIQAITDDFFENIHFLGSRPSPDWVLPIPPPIFGQLRKNVVYSLQIRNESNNELVMKEITDSEFAEQNQASWVFLSKAEVKIPETLHNLPWEKSKFFWSFEDDFLIIRFKNLEGKV